jgi:outer membrane protein OmpA-like peptidoglycan-associated protein
VVKTQKQGFPNHNARDQTSPFLHIDGRTLYFSSSGHGGLGGLDVMLAKKDTLTDQWKAPMLIGKPVSTADNDYFFSIPASGDYIYFASDRQGAYGGFDIYTYPLEQWQRPDIIATLAGKVVDAESGKPVAAKVRIERLKDGSLLQEFDTDSIAGNFFVVLRAGETYGISVSADGYTFASENYEVKIAEGYNELSKTFKLSKIELGSIVELVNLFFDTGKWDLRPESESELKRIDELMKKYKTMKIEVQGFADSVGSSEFNLKLSKFRAKAVKDWLIWHGMAEDRVAYKGFGEEIAGATPEELQRSRRVQFVIIELDGKKK